MLGNGYDSRGRAKRCGEHPANVERPHDLSVVTRLHYRLLALNQALITELNPYAQPHWHIVDNGREHLNKGVRRSILVQAAAPSGRASSRPRSRRFSMGFARLSCPSRSDICLEVALLPGQASASGAWAIRGRWTGRCSAASLPQ